MINFDIPETYNNYKENGLMVGDESGIVLSLLMPQKTEEMETLSHLQHKFQKNFQRDEMMKCLPVMWTELTRLKSRVETVVNTLSNKNV